jgi:nicotinate-nucleotide pyrophosphorylase (carboxylating)
MTVQTNLETLVRASLEEDISQRDITTEACVPEDVRCEARLYAKQDGVLSGMVPFRLAFELLDADLANWEAKKDGERFQKGDMLAKFEAHTRAILTGERVGMNFVQHLSGVATLTAEFVKAVEGLKCKVCNTRKTTPMLRYLEKAAVVHGGGVDHRYNLFNGILIKENHITAAGGIRQAIEKASNNTHHLMRVAVEVENLNEFDEALASGADVILLDNMSLDDMRESARRAQGHRVVLEGSGNASLENIRAMAETGVQFISVGKITHSAPAIDMTLLIDNVWCTAP